MIIGNIMVRSSIIFSSKNGLDLCPRHCHAFTRQNSPNSPQKNISL